MNTREIFGEPYNGSICGIVKLYLYGSLDMRGRCEITYIRPMRKACYRAYSIVHFFLYKIIFNLPQGSNERISWKNLAKFIIPSSSSS